MININLLPKELRRSTGPDYWKVGAGAVAAIGLLTILGFELTSQGTLRALNRDIAVAQSEIAVRQKDVDERNALRAEKTQLEATTNVVNVLRQNNEPWSVDLARFVRQLPQGQSAAPSVALASLDMRQVAAPAANGAASQPAPNTTPGLYDGKIVAREVQINGRARSSEALVRFVNAFEQAQDFGVQFQNAARDPETGDYTFAVTVGMTPLPTSATSTASTATTSTTSTATDSPAPAAPSGESR